MNMSEFDGRPPGSPSDPSQERKRPVPEDFSEDELAFAREMEALFPIDEEELPPFYVQTLMAAEDPRLQVADPAFEKKVSARVFRRLNLRRRLFRSTQAADAGRGFHLPRISRSFIAVSAACLVFMLSTMVATSTLFAAGLSYLLAGTHSGVVQVAHYPVTPAPTPAQMPPLVEQKQISLEQAQQALHFPIYWPDYLPSRYNQSDTYVYDADQSWADGPIMVVDFYYSVPGQLPRQFSVCEFKPQGKVLQVVQDGSAIKIGQDESSSAVYVQGQWKPDGSSSYAWVYNNRSTLIYEHDGLVFWIVGDRMSGLGEDVLYNIANSLHPFDAHSVHMSQVIRATGEAPSVFADDVVYLDDPGNAGGPSFILVGDPPMHSSKHLDIIP